MSIGYYESRRHLGQLPIWHLVADLMGFPYHFAGAQNKSLWGRPLDREGLEDPAKPPAG